MFYYLDYNFSATPAYHQPGLW